MNDEEFRSAVLDLGGTPPEFFNHPELLELFLPLLKNDFRLAETHVSLFSAKPLDVAISVFFGINEDLSPEQCDGWKKQSLQRCSIHHFPGGHFFLHNYTGELVRIINQTLTPHAVTKAKPVELLE